MHMACGFDVSMGQSQRLRIAIKGNCRARSTRMRSRGAFYLPTLETVHMFTADESGLKSRVDLAGTGR